MKQNILPFIGHQRLKQLLITLILMMYLNQSIVRLKKTYKNLFDRVQVKLLIQ